MIDNDLIKHNSQRLINSILNKRQTVVEDLYRIGPVLCSNILEKIKKYTESTHVSWQEIKEQSTLPRKKVSWDQDTVIEELHEIFESATDTINNIFIGHDKYFWGVTLWKDSPGYYIPWHTDNPDIDIAVQIYLFDQISTGTVFKSNDHEVLVESQHNHGYMIKNFPTCILHRTQNVIPESTTRYSLYAVWSRLPKHVPDS